MFLLDDTTDRAFLEQTLQDAWRRGQDILVHGWVYSIANGLVFLSGLPPFDPQTGEILPGPIERQTELVLEQMKRCLEAAGASLDNVMKCNIYCTSARHFAAVNSVYRRYFPVDPPARIFVCVPEWTGPFDIEIDCVAMAD